MTTTLVHPLPLPPLEVVDEAAARRALRDQIAGLEAELGALGPGLPAPRDGARPRLLSLAELELTRDGLLADIRRHQRAVAERAERQEQMRCLREEALADPAAHRFVQITNEDCGVLGCVALHVRPRFGILGMLMNWWRVRISSGCP